jgi:hypothetical protein
MDEGLAPSFPAFHPERLAALSPGTHPRPLLLLSYLANLASKNTPGPRSMSHASVSLISGPSLVGVELGFIFLQPLPRHLHSEQGPRESVCSKAGIPQPILAGSQEDRAPQLSNSRASSVSHRGREGGSQPEPVPGDGQSRVGDSSCA